MTEQDATPIPPVEALKQLADRLQREVHDRAVYSNAVMLNPEYWKHHAGDDWPDVDDGSYQAFENCQHPDCKLVREAAPIPSPQTWQPQQIQLEFEYWMRVNNPDLPLARGDQNDPYDYVNAFVETAWEGWRAGFQASTIQSPDVVASPRGGPAQNE